MDRAPRHSAMTGNAVKRYQIAGRPLPANAVDFLPDVVVDAQAYDALREIANEQRHRLECLCEGTDGSTTALTRIGRLEHERDQLQDKINSILMMVTTDQESKASFIARVRLILGEKP